MSTLEPDGQVRPPRQTPWREIVSLVCFLAVSSVLWLICGGCL